MGLSIHPSASVMSSTQKPTLDSASTDASEPTYYDILQISCNATPEEIKAAYRSLVIGCHPDKARSSKANEEQHNNFTNIISEGLSAIDIDDDEDDCQSIDQSTEDCNGNGKDGVISNETAYQYPISAKDEDVSEDQHTSAFHRIQKAYNCLRDPKRRRQYDESINRKEERDEWKYKGATEVNLSDMGCDMCCIVDEEEDTDDESTHNDERLQKVYFHSCRCGETFQIIQEEILDSIPNAEKGISRNSAFTNRVWQCESCSLTIRIHIDIDIERNK